MNRYEVRVETQRFYIEARNIREALKLAFEHPLGSTLEVLAIKKVAA